MAVTNLRDGTGIESIELMSRLQYTITYRNSKVTWQSCNILPYQSLTISCILSHVSTPLFCHSQLIHLSSSWSTSSTLDKIHMTYDSLTSNLIIPTKKTLLLSRIPDAHPKLQHPIFKAQPQPRLYSHLHNLYVDVHVALWLTMSIP